MQNVLTFNVGTVVVTTEDYVIYLSRTCRTTLSATNCICMWLAQKQHVSVCLCVRTCKQLVVDPPTESAGCQQHAWQTLPHLLHLSVQLLPHLTDCCN